MCIIVKCSQRLEGKKRQCYKPNLISELAHLDGHVTRALIAALQALDRDVSLLWRRKLLVFALLTPEHRGSAVYVRV